MDVNLQNEARSAGRRAQGSARLLWAAASAAALMAAASAAQAGDLSADLNGLTWTAQKTIVGVESTGTLASGGKTTYTPTAPAHNGVVSLIMNYGAGGSFICSGSLLGDGRSIATAGHCVSEGGGVKAAGLISTTAYFYDYSVGSVDAVPFAGGGSTAIAVSDYFVNSNYTGEVVDQNDIAVLRLSDLAPGYATRYDLYDGGDLEGQTFNVAGYGRRSDTGGDVGANLGVGRLRQGDNRYDFRFGDSDFGGFFTGGFFGTADIDYTYLSDFDNGLAANDASCAIGGAFGFNSSKYCDTGLGKREVGIAGGDSGGPGFIDGKLASINSFGLTFGSNFGDKDNTLNTTFGEFSGYVPTSIHAGFIRSAMVPEPGTWALMIGGFGLAGVALRRRRVVAA